MNNEFVWTDELAIEFGKLCMRDLNRSSRQQLGDFKQFHSPKPKKDNKGYVLIHSVKRIDGRIIAIGDDEYKQGTVKSMHVGDDKEIYALTTSGTWNINELKDEQAEMADINSSEGRRQRNISEPKPQAEKDERSFTGKRIIEDEIQDHVAAQMRSSDFKKFWSEPQAENKPKYSANFLWGFSNDSIESLGYEFANAKTEEYQKECWGSLLLKIKETPPQPQKLFTTEDGKDIFENDRCWYVQRINDELSVDFYDFVNSGYREEDLLHYPDLYKYFSTKEAAEKYIAENKPQPVDSFLQYLIDKKEENVKSHDFETASNWRMVERLYRSYLKIREKPPGNYISLDEIVEDYLASAPQPQKEEQGGTVKVGDRFRSGTHVKPQEQRIEVKDFEFDEGWVKYYLSRAVVLSPEKYVAIKQAIEGALNEPQVSKEDLNRWLDEFNKRPIECHPVYTQQQVDELCDKAKEEGFNAGRELLNFNTVTSCKYKTFEDYKKAVHE